MYKDRAQKKIRTNNEIVELIVVNSEHDRKCTLAMSRRQWWQWQLMPLMPLTTAGQHVHMSAHIVLRTYYIWKFSCCPSENYQSFYWWCYRISKSELISLANREVYTKLVSLVLCDVEVQKEHWEHVLNALGIFLIWQVMSKALTNYFII